MSMCRRCHRYVSRGREYCSECSTKESDFPSSTMMGEGVVGIRVYTVDPKLRWLIGGYGAKWYSPRQHARCKPPKAGALLGGWPARSMIPAPGPCPHIEHRCGINAYRPDSLGHDTCGFSRNLGISVMNVYAICHLWGRIIEHEDGFRASDCRVVGLVYSAYYGQHGPQVKDFVSKNSAWSQVGIHRLMNSVGTQTEEMISFLQEISLSYATPLIEIPKNEA